MSPSRRKRVSVKTLAHVRLPVKSFRRVNYQAVVDSGRRDRIQEENVEDKPADKLLQTVSGQYGAILIDPPWRFMNRTGKVGPEHKRLHRYKTMSFEEIAALRRFSESSPR